MTVSRRQFVSGIAGVFISEKICSNPTAMKLATSPTPVQICNTLYTAATIPICNGATLGIPIASWQPPVDIGIVRGTFQVVGNFTGTLVPNFAAANVGWAFVSIESPVPPSLVVPYGGNWSGGVSYPTKFLTAAYPNKTLAGGVVGCSGTAANGSTGYVMNNSAVINFDFSPNAMMVSSSEAIVIYASVIDGGGGVKVSTTATLNFFYLPKPYFQS